MIVLLLGAGGVGAAAARYAAELPAVTHLLVADRDPAAAARALAGAGGRGGTATVEAADHPGLVKLMTRADAVVSCVGPFFRFGPPVLAAAIAARRPYLDICDDWEPTLAMLEHHAAARAAGVTAVVGMGASPGAANLLGAAVMAAVPDATRLVTGWSLDDDTGSGESAANEHWVHQATGLIRVWREGVYVDEPPLAELIARYPGLPPRPALTIGHPEAVTLPRAYPALRECLNVMTLPASLAVTLKRAAAEVDAGRSTIPEAVRAMVRAHRPGSEPPLPEYPGMWAVAEGPSGRAAARLASYGRFEGMAGTTAGPLVAALDLLLAGGAARAGVLTPEEAFTPAAYFAALARVARVDGPMLDLVREAA